MGKEKGRETEGKGEEMERERRKKERERVREIGRKEEGGKEETRSRR